MAYALYESSQVGGSSEFWDMCWEKTSLERQLAMTTKDDELNIFLKYLPKNGKILEAGCGLGRWVICLKNRGYDIKGIDFSKQVIDLIKNYDPAIPVELGNIMDINYPDNYFDVYISLGVVEHFVEGPFNVLEEAKRVVKQNGMLFISVPVFNPIRHVTLPFEKLFRFIIENYLVRKLLGKSPYPPKNFIEYRFIRKEFSRHLLKLGFEIEEIIPFCHIELGLFNHFLEPIFFLRNKHLLAIFRRTAKYLKNICPWLAPHMTMWIVRKIK